MLWLDGHLFICRDQFTGWHLFMRPPWGCLHLTYGSLWHQSVVFSVVWGQRKSLLSGRPEIWTKLGVFSYPVVSNVIVRVNSSIVQLLECEKFFLLKCLWDAVCCVLLCRLSWAGLTYKWGRDLAWIFPGFTLFKHLTSSENNLALKQRFGLQVTFHIYVWPKIYAGHKYWRTFGKTVILLFVTVIAESDQL